MSNENGALEGAQDLIDVWAGVDASVEKALAEDGDEDIEESEDDTVEEDDEEEIEDDEEEDEADDDDGDEESEEDEEVAVLKAKTKDGVVEVPANATFRFKANGKYRTVTLEELKNDFGGRVAYDEKIKQVNELKRKYNDRNLEDDLQIEMMKDSFEAVKQGDIGAGLEAIGEVLGLPPGEYFNAMINAMNGFFSDLVKLPANQRQAMVREARAKGLESRYERKEKRAGKIESSKKFTQDLEAFSTKYDISEDEIEYCYNYLKQKAEADGKETGEVKKVTVNSITEFALNRRIMRGVDDAVEELEADLSDDERFSIFKIIKEVDPDGSKFESADYVDVVSASLEESPKAALRRKAKKATPKRKPKKKKAIQANSLSDLWGQSS